MIDHPREDIFVYLIDLPFNTKEAVTPNEDGSFTIFINSRLSCDAQLLAYEHALRHIQNADFSRSDVQAIEADAHKDFSAHKAKPIPASKYLEKINQIQKRRRKLKRLMKQDEERVNFVLEHCDTFARAENYKLYGDDL